MSVRPGPLFRVTMHGAVLYRPPALLSRLSKYTTPLCTLLTEPGSDCYGLSCVIQMSGTCVDVCEDVFVRFSVWGVCVGMCVRVYLWDV